MNSILTTICKQMLKESKGDLLDWLNCQKNKYQGLPCELLPILSIDTIKEYRNKCEFTVGNFIQILLILQINYDKLNILCIILI